MAKRDEVDQDSVDTSRTHSGNYASDIPMRARSLVAGGLVPTIDINETYIVWFSYTVGNWKALVSTLAEDDLYYEVTHNNERNETYIDTYRKINNTRVRGWDAR